MKPLFCVFFSILLGVIGQLLMKVGLTRLGELNLTLKTLPSLIYQFLTTPYILLGFLCYIISSVTWLVALSKLELSYIYPMVSLSYVLVVGASIVFLGERVSLTRWAGVGIIIAGVLLLSRS
jgi:drug/metabolite transporter (DMT)-like permease